jgi:Protein of unknown function (DUF2721)
LNESSVLAVLQVAVGPVILISGVGLLLLSMTNRFGRIIDRSRILAMQLRGDSEVERRHATAQVDILWRRALLVRRAITFASISMLLAAVLVIAIFIAALRRVDIGTVIATLFGGCLGALIASLVAFIGEINQSLLALRLDLFGTAGDERGNEARSTREQQS